MRHAVSRVGIVFAPALLLALAATPLFADSGASHQAPQSPPIKMGTSGSNIGDASNAFCCGGTLGSLIMRDGLQYILSNNHVLAISGAASPGGDVLQPGLIDVQCNPAGTTTVGTFAGDLVPLGTANVDVALALANATVDSTGAILDIGQPCTAIQDPTIGLKVTKSGRTTGQTFGTVQAVNVSVLIQYQRGCHQHRKFRILYSNQVTIGPGGFSGAGDSGSLVVSDDGTPNPVGLLYAGSATLTAANPVSDVVSALGAGGHSVSFVGQTCAPAAASPWNASALVPRGPSPDSVAAARTVKERHESALFARPETLGVGVGADDADPARAVIVLYVETPKGGTPRGLPAELDGVKVRAVPTDPIEAL